MPLTINRVDYTASELNDVFESLRNQLAYQLPPNIRTPLNSTAFDDLELNESDDVALSVYDPASVARALVYISNNRVNSNEQSVAGMFQYSEDSSLNSIIDVVSRITEPNKVDPYRSYSPKKHASVSMTSGLTITGERFITDDSVGWYSSGFAGKEDFSDSGYNGWYSGTGTTVSVWYLADNGYDNWSNVNTYKIGNTESFTDGWPQGVEPSSGCGGSGLLIEDLSSQAGSASGTFTLSNEYEIGTIRVYWNGQRQDSSEITELNNLQFSFAETTYSGDRIIVDYSST